MVVSFIYRPQEPDEHDISGMSKEEWERLTGQLQALPGVGVIAVGKATTT